MSQELSIARKQYTPRDKLGKDRFNVKLSFEAEVPSNSYLFTGAFISRIDIYSRQINILENIAQKYLSGEIDEDEAINAIYSQHRVIEIKPSKKPPRYLDKIIIPGSSIKGVIRSRVEYKCSPSISCYSVEDRTLPPQQFYKRHVKYWGRDVVNARGTCTPDNVCIVCDLFGAPELQSRAYFSDMLMTRGETSLLSNLGVEAINPNSKFNLEVHCINSSFLDLGLLFAGFEIFTGSYVPICAYKYRYNPKIDGEYYMGKYVFGLVKFSIRGFKEYISRMLLNLTLNDLVLKSREALVNTLKDKIDLGKGAIQ
jgi:hypothetical protein